MTEKKQRRPPKGINPKTGKPYEPVKRDEWDKLVKRAAKSPTGGSG